MEQEILNIAIKNLSTATGLMIETNDLLKPFNNFHDGVLTIFNKGVQIEIPYTIKRKITVAELPFLQDLPPKKGLIILEYASKSVKEQLKRLEINYLEISGNAYISFDKIYIFINTNKRIKLEGNDSNAAFSKTGLKVVYQLLINKNSIDYSYRNLGEISGVSIDTIGRVYGELIRDKYVVKINNRKHSILDYERLFKDWVTLFNKTLRPKLKKRSFRFSNNQNIQSLFEANFSGEIGGELAAEKLSKYNIAEKANIYVKGSFVELAMKLNLRPDSNGQVTMIEQFWNDTSDKNKKVVDLPLVYADLISDPKPRNLKTAKLIFNEYFYQPI